jgi:RNA-directed DNA polymerase
MPKRHDQLFQGIANFQALIAAARRAVLGKRRKPRAAAFMADLETEVLRLERELRSRTWRPGGYVIIRVNDSKPRIVSAAPFRDRVVHHALCHVIQPIFERGFIHDSYANRKNKGAHRALARYEHYRDRFAYVLRCDIHRYFPAIDHEILRRDLRRRIACARTLWLCDTIIDRANQQEPVERYFPGDNLFAPFERRRGLPIGNLTSQFFAHVYLDPLDDHAVLQHWRAQIGRFLEGRRLILSAEKTSISPTCAPAAFLGFITAPGRRRLPEDNVRRFRNRLRGLRDRWRAGRVGMSEVRVRVGAWVAHAEHADTWRLRHAIFRGGTFDPAREPGRSPGRARGARRLLEQSTEEPALREPQQERARQPEQQSGLSGLQHAYGPESSGSRIGRACG